MNADDLDADDFDKFSNHFAFQEVIGQGAFATVISAMSKTDGNEYAVKVSPRLFLPPATLIPSIFWKANSYLKVIPKQGSVSRDWDKLRMEAQILSELNHPNIVKFKEVNCTS